MIRRNGRACAGFDLGLGSGDPTADSVGKQLPPLELRTAYTIKGLGIGGGGLVGYLLGGPIGMLGLGFAGWWAGNAAACRAERQYSSG